VNPADDDRAGEDGDALAAVEAAERAAVIDEPHRKLTPKERAAFLEALRHARPGIVEIREDGPRDYSGTVLLVTVVVAAVLGFAALWSLVLNLAGVS
jgi:hypothetical protein